MEILLNTDKNIQGTESLDAAVTEKVQQQLKHFSNHISRIEIHLSDQNSQKSGTDDIQCRMEARIKKMQPVIVTSRNSNKEKALTEAADKMKATLTTVIGKMRNR